MQPTLTDLEAIARGAGAILQAGLGRPLDVQHKGETDLVTEIDHRSESFVISEIQRRFPGDRVIAEESGSLPGDPDRTWYVDPLDGTVNYARGVPFYAVSIAFAKNGQVQTGVVYDPVRDHCFGAVRGEGAQMDGKPLEVSRVAALEQALLVTGFPYDVKTSRENNLDHYNYFSLRSMGVRRLGSAALDLCYVAAGHFDGYWEIRINSWDIAAGALIVEEAGGLASSVSGREDFLTAPQSILATNRHLHPVMLARLARIRTK